MVGIPKVDTCCIFFDIERGSFLVGVAVALTALITFTAISIRLTELIIQEINVTDLTQPVDGELIEYAAIGVIAVLRLITSIVHLIGVSKKNELCVKVFLITMIVSLVMYFAFLIYEFTKLLEGAGGIFFLSLTMNIGSGIYFYIVVYNYYTDTFLEKEVGFYEAEKSIIEVTPPKLDQMSVKGYMATKYYTSKKNNYTITY